MKFILHKSFSYLLFAFFTFSFTAVKGQVSLTISTPQVGTIDNVAQQSVHFLPGHHYSGASGAFMLGRVDPSISVTSSYTPGFTASDLDNRVLDTDLAVGAINGTHGVSSTGGATYTMPINVPIGTAGMQPNLSIVYNSQGGSGLLGWGWNIAGLSSITRVAKTVYHDGLSEGVEMSAADAFALDGNRLIDLNRTGPSGGDEYTLEREMFYKVEAFGSLGGGPEHFEVQTQDGLTMTFGGNSNARFLAYDPNFPGVMIWSINRIEDRNGNYMTFEYNNDDRQPRIEKISYTGNTNAGITPYNEVHFYYNYKTDENEAFIKGSSIKDKVVLRKITATNNQKMFRDYEFSYAQSFNTLLKEVKEIAFNGEELNATMFQYGEMPAPLTTQFNASSSLVGLSADVQAAQDFNNDGLSDIVVWNKNYVFGQAQFIDWTAMTSDGNGDFNVYATGSVPQGNWFVGGDLQNFRLSSPGRVFDFDGDGREDILLRKNTVIAQTTVILEVVVDRITAQNATNRLTLFAGAQQVDPNKHIYTGDFDGNGTDDVLLFSRPSSSGPYNVTLYSWNNGVQVRALPSNNIMKLIPFAERVYVVDFDGDGKSEIMGLYSDAIPGYSNTCGIYELSEANQTLTANLLLNTGHNGFPNRYHDKFFLGDFNGDGKTDILVSPQNSASWSIGYSTGSSSGFSEVPFTLPLVYGTSSRKININDFNGDGKADIMNTYFSFANQHTNVVVHYSLGKSFTTVSSIYNGSANELTMGDFNGDGIVELMNRDYYLHPVDILRPNNGSEHLLLQKVSDGFNNQVGFTYKELTDASVYTPQTTAAFPLVDIQYPIKVVAEVETENGIGGKRTVDYSYEGAQLHLQGRGWLGFEKVVQHDLLTNTFIENKNTFNLTYFISLPDFTKTYVGGFTAASLISKDQYVYNISHTSGGNLWTSLHSQTTTDYLRNGATTTILNGYNFTDRLLTSTSVVKAFGGNNVQEESSVFTYINPGNWWRKAKLETATTTLKRKTVVPINRSMHYSYNSNGVLITKVSNQNSSKPLTMLYEDINDFGMAEKTTVSATGINRVTLQEYDNNGRFVIKTTNALGQESTMDYNELEGVLAKSTGVDGLSTRYIYDGFGRLVQSTTPDGITTTTTRSWNLNGPLTRYDELTERPGAPTVKTTYDMLGRALRTERDGFDAPIFTETTYDVYGNVKTTNLPHYQFDPLVTTTYNYDIRFKSRLKQETSSQGSIDHDYAYAAGNETVTTTLMDGTQRSVTTDMDGKIIESTDVAGTLTFTYNSEGSKLTTSMNNATLNIMKYDDVGFQTELNDLGGALLTTYNYNALGELITQGGSSSSDYTMVYNDLGQLITKTGTVEGTTTYEYVTQGDGMNQVKKITGYNGIIKEYTYDELNRLKSTTETIDGTGYTTQYDYDAFSNLATTVYPSGFSVENAYSTAGYLNSVKDATNNVTLWQATAMNALDQYTQTTLGQMSHQSDFDPYGFLEQSTTGNVFDEEYDFNITNGNLLSRIDHINGGATETFIYDNLNRLLFVSATQGGTVLHPLKEVTYNDRGTIIFKTELGDYTVTPYGRTMEVENLSGSIDITAQDIVYSGFNKPNSIVEGDYTLTYTHGPEDLRKKTVLTNNGTTEYTRYFLGEYEKTIRASGTTEIHYIAGGEGLAALYVIENGVGTIYYAHTNHLGSIVKVTDASGILIAEQSFDAWGKHRNPSNLQNSYTPNLPDWLYRGYTGHEHLLEFGLINMNGRHYDPILGRMLSPDNYVQSPLFTQNYNRYSYVLNNPLKYTDPSGEIVHVIVGAAVGGLINLGVKAYQGKINSIGDGLAAFGIGAAVGAVGAATGGAAFLAAGGAAGGVGGFAAGFVGGAVGSAFATPIQSIGNSLYFGDPMLTPQQYGQSVLFGGLFGGTLQGVSAIANGRSFFNGNLPKTTPTLNPGPTTALTRPDPIRSELNTDGLRSQVKQINDPLDDLSNMAPLKINREGIPTIEGFTKHGLNRAIGDPSRLGVKPNAILDAIRNPIKVGNIVTDQLGRQSQRFVGRLGEVVINPQTGKIISVNPTSTLKVARILRQLGR